MEERKIFAQIMVDEDLAMRYAEVNGIPNDGTLSYLEREFGWLEPSGIRLEKAFISDDDDTEDWGRYINYLVSWAFEHTWQENDYAQALTYKEWRVENGLSVYPPAYRKKMLMICPEQAVDRLLETLGDGEPTINGDRISRYLDIATVYGDDRFVRVALIEEAKDLHPEDQGYALHILNDIDGTDGRLVSTESLDEDQLLELMKEVMEALQEGRM